MLNSRFLSCLFFYFWTIWLTSCSTGYYLQHYPGLTEDVYYRKVLLADKKADSDNNNINHLKNALVIRTKYTFAFVMEKADRLIDDDYHNGKNLYDAALKSFKKAIYYGEKAISIRHPQTELWLNGETDQINFTDQDIPYLFWLGAAYGGAISSSRGNPEWVIQLPKVGKLLEAALYIDPSWNYGAIHSAMISYSVVRKDVGGKNIELAKKHYQEAVRLSKGLDAGPYISYAEKVLVSTQDKENYIKILNTVLEMNIHQVKDLELGNVIAYDRAQWLLSRIDELFY